MWLLLVSLVLQVPLLSASALKSDGIIKGYSNPNPQFDANTKKVQCGEPQALPDGFSALLRSADEGDENQTHVVGSPPTDARQYPWVVRLKYETQDEERVCLGSIVGERFVLTARMCVDAKGPDGRSNRELEPGDIAVTQGRPGMDDLVRQVHEIKPYFPEGFDHGYYAELALLELVKPFDWTNTTRPICLPKEFRDKEQGAVLVVHQNRKQEKLFLDTLYIADYDKCRGLWSNLTQKKFVNDYFCVRHDSSKKTPLFTPGAPVMRYEEQDHYAQVGIVTHYAKDQKLALATRVQLFKEGILDLQKSLSLSFVGRIIANEAQ